MRGPLVEVILVSGRRRANKKVRGTGSSMIRKGGPQDALSFLDRGTGFLLIMANNHLSRI